GANFFFQAEDGIRAYKVTGVQTCALPIFVALIAMMSFVLSSGGSSPASDPPRTQCCLPSGQGQGCVLKTPNACRQGGGLDVGPEIGRASCREKCGAGCAAEAGDEKNVP